MQRVRQEERDDRLDQIRSPPHHVAVQVLPMVVLAPIRDDAAHAEESHELLQSRKALRALRDSKLVRHLIAGPVAFSPCPAWLPDKTDGEASLSVYKTNNPAKLNQSFLLIFCTHGIFTVPPACDGTR